MRRVISTVLLALLMLTTALPVAAAPAAPANGELAYGDSVRDKVTDATGDAWTFEGDAGDMVQISMTSGRMDTYLELYDADGKLLTSDDDSLGDGDSQISRFVLPDDGTYTIIARGYSGATGSYTLTLDAGAVDLLAYGDVVVTEMLDAENGDLWAFYGEVGDMVTIALESDTFDTYFDLYGPNGMWLASNDDTGDDTNSFIEDQLLGVAGYYVIEVGGWGASEGDEYTISVDGAAAELVAYGDVIEAELTDEDGDRWLFYGESGDVVTIYMESDEIDAYLELYGPDGNYVTSADDDDTEGGSNALIADYTLNTSGVYAIAAQSYNDDNGAYVLTLDGTGVQAIAYGETLSGELTGEARQTFAFEGQAGDVVRIRLDSEDFDAYLELRDSANNYATSDDDSGPESNAMIVGYVLPNTGRYIITVSTWNTGEEGAFDLTLEAVGEDTIAYGDEVRGRLRDFSDFYVFTGETGDTVDITLETRAFDAYVELYGPDGYYLTYNDDAGDGSSNARIQGYVLTATGKYTIIVRDYDEQGTGSYTLFLDGSGPELLAYGDSVTGDIIDLTGDVWAFEGNAGDFVTIEMSSDSIDTWLELSDPDGAVLTSNDDQSADNTNARIQMALPSTGRYIIKAQGLDTEDVGPYTLSLTLGAGAPPVTTGGPAVVTLPEEVPAVVSIDGVSCSADGAYFILSVDGTELDNFYYYSVMVNVDDGAIVHAFPLLDEPLAWPFAEPITIFLGDSDFNLTDLETGLDAALAFADEWDLWSGEAITQFGVAMNNTIDQPPMRYLVATTSGNFSLAFEWQIEDTDDVQTAETAVTLACR